MMKDALLVLDDLIQAIAYDEDAHIHGVALDDELRKILVDFLEITKKTQFLLQNKRYKSKKYNINQNDIAYRIRQIIYYLNSGESLLWEGSTLTSQARNYLMEHLGKLVSEKELRLQP